MTKVCVIDDDGALLDAIGKLLSLEGFAVETYASAVEFLRAERLQHARCVVTDIQMPGGVSGLDLLSEMSRRGAACPVIVMSGQPASQVEDKAVRLGAARYLQKPVFPNDLIAAVKTAMQGAKIDSVTTDGGIAAAPAQG